MFSKSCRYLPQKLSQSIAAALLIGVAVPQAPGAAQQTPLPTLPPSRSQPSLLLPTGALDVNRSPYANYILGPGDEVNITVIGFEEFDGSYAVLPDGSITLPLIGSVTATGQTIDSLSRDLTIRLSQFLIEPVVSVRLTTLRPVIVNVAGEVYRPGPIQLNSLSNTNNRVDSNSRINLPTLSAALLAAGGIKRQADIRHISVKRMLPGGRTETFNVNLWNAITSSNAPDHEIVLRAGDTIFVPQAVDGAEIDPQLVASSTLAPNTVRVRVVGEVTRPGQVEVPPNSSISSAVAIAGGPTEDAQLKEVALVRMREGGQVEEQVIDLRNLVDEYQIQDGDVVFVPKAGTPALLDGVRRFAGAFISPINLILQILRL
ncbi:MAG: polysaccharide biosynthesis/export family protein [Leptolyngbyaceae cyanobacterium MO_188.B28]|nr:polysaccharide biosynthesis/export family protein [Leptolyngbyaceae cyanobacterium MO_188.B28]